MVDSAGMGEAPGQQARQGDRFAWIDPGVSVWDQWGAAPPPPKVRPSTSPEREPSEASATASPAHAEPQAEPEPIEDLPMPEPAAEQVGGTEGAPTFHEFDAELDVAELDERLRPVTTWSARSSSVNRSSLTIRSRRMCYAKKMLLVAVHLIDDQPTILAGRVTECEYDGEALYTVKIELVPRPSSEEIRQWIMQR